MAAVVSTAYRISEVRVRLTFARIKCATTLSIQASGDRIVKMNRLPGL